MKTQLMQTGGGFVSAVLGAVAMTALLIGYHWLVARSLLSDGQYVFFVFISAPSGAAAGLGTLGLAVPGQADSSRRAILTIRQGIVTLIPPLLYCGLTASNSGSIGENPVQGFMGTTLALLPLYLWGAMLIAAGLYLKRQR